MNNFFEQFKNEAKHIRLTSQEKENMRLALSRVFTETASAKKVPSPYIAYSFSFSSFHSRMLVPLALVFMVVIGTTGTAYAAQGALPGDILYPIKVNVTEKIEVAAASNPVAKAQVHAVLAQRRAEEAEVLASQGRLDATTSAQLAETLVAEASTSEQISQQIAATDPGTAAEIQIQLSSALEAHSDIIARLGTDSSNVPTQENSNALASAVRVQSGSNNRGILATALSLKTQKSAQSQTPPQATTFTATLMVEDAAEPTPTIAPGYASARVMMAPTANKVEAQESVAVSKEDAAKMEKRASKEFAQAREQFNALKDSLDTDTAAKIAARFSVVSDLLVVGNNSFKAEQYGSANVSFTQALRGAVELKAYLKAGKDFKNFLPKLLEQAVQVPTPNLTIPQSVSGDASVVSTPPSSAVDVEVSTPPSQGGSSGASAGVEVHIPLPKLSI